MIKAIVNATITSRLSSCREQAGRASIIFTVLALHLFAARHLLALLTIARPHPQGNHAVAVYLLTPPRPAPLQHPVTAQQRNPEKSGSNKAALPAIATFPSSPPLRNESIPSALTQSQDTNPTPGPSVAQQALDGVEKAMRELRKEGALQEQAKPEARPDRFARAISSAAMPKETTMESFVSNDGRVITRVSGPHGTYCVETALDSDPDGIDHMQHGVGIKKVHCPY